jgi:hypothetical protein
LNQLASQNAVGLSPLRDTPYVARFLNISELTLRKWRWAGKGPAYIKCGRRCLYSEADLLEYLRAQRRGGAA